MTPTLFSMAPLIPALVMVMVMVLSLLPGLPVRQLWRLLTLLSGVALLGALVAAGAGQPLPVMQPWLGASPFGAMLAVLVQLLCTVIAAFSARYLEGEPGQRRYVTALAGAVTAVHLLLMADHWVVVIAAWALVGVALQHLLCFYPDRPFALLAAHKKQIADRLADALLVAAAALAWNEVGSGSLPALWTHLERQGMSVPMQFSAVCLVLAVVLRTALMPVHGWLIQVMEAPTPVSALLHAGVVNLGGYVLIRFAPLLEQAMPARTLLLLFGLGTAVLAGMVMLTRISIKVRLAWSTVAQMGFMLLECGLGLYTLAAMHLVGHSLYKAHTFLSASTVVRQTRLQAMHSPEAPLTVSVVLAPVLVLLTVLLVQALAGRFAWPWWWTAVLGLAWAPLLWLRAGHSSLVALGLQCASGVAMVAVLTGAALLAHALPFGLQDAPHPALGLVAMLGMLWLYICLAVLQLQPQMLRTWRRWSYAGFYLDESYTRLAMQIWPTRWAPEVVTPGRPMLATSPMINAANEPNSRRTP